MVLMLTHKWRPCHVCGRRVQRTQRPLQPQPKRAAGVEVEVVDTEDVRGPFHRGGDYGGGPVPPGHCHGGHKYPRLHPRWPQGIPRAGRRRRTEIKSYNNLSLSFQSNDLRVIKQFHFTLYKFFFSFSPEFAN